MCLLDRVVSHTPELTCCAVHPEASGLFLDGDLGVPAWVGIEYLAQCVAAHAGLCARDRGEEPPMGLFLGSRHLDLRVATLPRDQELLAHARQLRGNEARLQTFACTLLPRAGAPAWIEGNLNVMLLDRSLSPTSATA